MQNLSLDRSALNSARGKHLTGKLSDLGRRPLHEFLDKLGRRHPAISADMMEMLEEYALVDAKFVKAAGLNEWPRVLLVVPNVIRSGAASHDDILRRALRSDTEGDAAQ
jgi:hypothetical protein